MSLSSTQLLSIKPSIGRRPVTLTDNAVTKVKHLISEESNSDTLGLRMAVRPGGCSGFSYELFFDSDIESDDIVADFDGLRVMIDRRSAERVQGSVVDYKDGLMEGGFSIENPSETRSCGCGKSFA